MNNRWVVHIENGNGVDEIDIHPHDGWKSLDDYQNFLMWLADNPQAWVTFQTVGPEIAVPVKRIVFISRIPTTVKPR